MCEHKKAVEGIKQIEILTLGLKGRQELSRLAKRNIKSVVTDIDIFGRLGVGWYKKEEEGRRESTPMVDVGFRLILIGGAEGSRTPDLLNAIQTRSQLRYSPTLVLSRFHNPRTPGKHCDPLMNTTVFQLKPAVHLEKSNLWCIPRQKPEILHTSA